MRLCSVFAAVAFGSAPAAAQTRDTSAAIALFDEGQALVAAGKYAQACQKYAESNRLDPQLGVLLHLADCYERNGQLASAWAAFRDAAELATRRADPRSKPARNRAAALLPRLSRLTVVVPPESTARGIEVRRDGIVLGPALWGLAIPVDPGRHTVEVRVPGQRPWRAELETGVEPSSKTVTVPVPSNAPAAASPHELDATSASPGPAGRERGSTQRVLGWTVVGLGAVGLGVGLVFQLERLERLDERDAICPSGTGCTAQDQTDIDRLTVEARSASTRSALGFVGGSVLAAGGTLLVLLAPTAARSPAVSFRVTPGPEYQSVSATYAW